MKAQISENFQVRLSTQDIRLGATIRLMTFAETIQSIMADRGMSQSELARRLSVTSQAVSQWVSGASVPRGSRLNAIADALGVEVGGLLPQKTSVYDYGVRQRIKEGMRKNDISEQELADRAEISLNQMRSVLSGALNGDELRRRAARLARPLGLSRDYIIYGDDGEPEPGLHGFKVEPPQSSWELRRTMPVWGTSECRDDGSISITMDIPDLAVDWINRPKIVEKVREAFGLYVVGSTMEPRWLPGELLVINPSRQPRPGDPVLVILKSDAGSDSKKRALFKRLISRSPNQFVLGQTNPAMQIELAAENVEQIWRIYEWGELVPSL